MGSHVTVRLDVFYIPMSESQIVAWRAGILLLLQLLEARDDEHTGLDFVGDGRTVVIQCGRGGQGVGRGRAASPRGIGCSVRFTLKAVVERVPNFAFCPIPAGRVEKVIDGQI